jgi:hypothetical protein
MPRSPKQLINALRSLPSTEPSKPGAEDVIAMQARADQAELLFWLAQRDRAPKGLRGTFTGLMSDVPLLPEA